MIIYDTKETYISDINKYHKSLVARCHFRMHKSILEKINMVFPDQCLIVELNDDDDFNGFSAEELIKLKLRRRYKVCDGIRPYTELPYEEGMIPIAFYDPIPNINK